MRSKTLKFKDTLSCSLLLALVVFITITACKKGSADSVDQTEWLDPLNVVSFNIGYDSPDDPNTLSNPWSGRKNFVKQIFEDNNFEIIGVQEPFVRQRDDITALLPQYGWVGTTVTGTTTTPEQLSVYIFYKKSRVSLTEWGKFWLSPTPDELSSGWDKTQYRICIWAKVKDLKTDKEFYFFSTHFHNKSEEEKMKSAELLLSKVPSIAGNLPFFITGDFNSNQNSETYKKMIGTGIFEDCYNIAEKKQNVAKGTYSGYDPFLSNSGRIDHVFLPSNRKDVKVIKWTSVIDNYNNKLPSDHYPVKTEISFAK